MRDPYSSSTTILGPDGRPARLTDSQRLQEVIGAYQSYLRFSFRLAPFNPDDLIGSKGYKIFDDMYHMACIAAPLDTIRDAVVYKGVQVHAFVPPGAETPDPQAQVVADALTYTINEIEDEAGNPQDPRDIVRSLLYGIFTGFSVGEIIWKLFEDGPYKGKNGLSQIAFKPSQQIGFEVDEKTLGVNAITSYTPMTGYQFGIPVEKCLRYTHKPKDALPYGTSIGRQQYRHFWTINTLMQFRNLFFQKLGIGFLKGTAPKSMLDDAQAAMDKAAQGSSLLLPDGVEAELLETNGMSAQAFEAAIESERQQCALAALHAVLTSGEGSHGATSAGSDVQSDTQQFSLASYRCDAEFVLNQQFVRRFVTDNYGKEALAYAPSLSLGDWDEADTAQLSGAVGTLVDKGILHPDDPQILQKLKFKPTPPKLKADLQGQRQRKQQNEDKALNATIQKGKTA